MSETVFAASGREDIDVKCLGVYSSQANEIRWPWVEAISKADQCKHQRNGGARLLICGQESDQADQRRPERQDQVLKCSW